jgi:hypothetical protein
MVSRRGRGAKGGICGEYIYWLKRASQDVPVEQWELNQEFSRAGWAVGRVNGKESGRHSLYSWSEWAGRVIPSGIRTTR